MEIGGYIAIGVVILIVALVALRGRKRFKAAYSEEHNRARQIPKAGRMVIGQVMILNDAVRSLQQAHPFATDLRREVVQSLQRFYVVQAVFNDAQVNTDDVSDDNLKKMIDAIDAKLSLHRDSRTR